MIKAVIFDMDGVLTDSFYAWYKTINYTSENFGFGSISEEKFKKTFGQSIETDAKELMQGKTAEEVGKAYSEKFPDFITEVRLIDNAKETLNTLNEKGIKLAIVTNAMRDVTEKILKAKEIRDYFEVIVGGDEVSNAKPDPEPLNKVLELLNVSKEEAVFIGDTIFDVQAGKSANIFTIGYKINADTKIDDLINIINIIDEK
ncbi:HAD family hydrolase [Nanoarchaeota archaeon]